MASTLQHEMPKSAVSHPLALLSLLFAVAVIFAFRQSVEPNITQCMVALIIAIALPHVTQQLPHIYSRLMQGNATDIRRIGYKLLGLVALYSVIMLAYLVFRGFTREFLQPLLHVPVGWVYGLLLATPFYIALTDRVMEMPEDGLYNLGRNVVGTAAMETDEALRQFLLGWLVKGFFGPLMIVFATNDLRELLTLDFNAMWSSPSGWHQLSYRLLFLIDVVFAATGYFCTLRLFNAQIRSTEPTLFGWVVCIICYPPFWNNIYANFIAYDVGTSWVAWFAGYPLLSTLWACAIVFCIAIYVWATVSFGMRFSNLTNRGIITNGPYRYLKHPAYVAKNISWWLVTMPFIPTNGAWQSFLNCLALLMVNGIYTLRAITEERHLSRDPDYMSYCHWMSRNSLAAKIKAVAFNKKTG
jgi:protein-S-isoprenylcysteine O-methyltransferase Ste14